MKQVKPSIYIVSKLYDLIELFTWNFIFFFQNKTIGLIEQNMLLNIPSI